mmetsp:Transcript_22192/g.37583  ORF Transcript_22192/g.37583 Transcript_22192/m.37583 type:complete len:212 (+) Transcript_22192:2069-2704(+)
MCDQHPDCRGRELPVFEVAEDVTAVLLGEGCQQRQVLLLVQLLPRGLAEPLSAALLALIAAVLMAGVVGTSLRVQCCLLLAEKHPSHERVQRVAREASIARFAFLGPAALPLLALGFRVLVFVVGAGLCMPPIREPVHAPHLDEPHRAVILGVGHTAFLRVQLCGQSSLGSQIHVQGYGASVQDRRLERAEHQLFLAHNVFQHKLSQLARP